MGLYPTGVAVVTAITSTGERLGATVSSFNAVSLEPPLVSFNIANTSSAAPLWADIEAFAVNLLGEGQREVSTRFARPRSDKWAGIVPETGVAVDAPLLPDVLGWIECRRYATYVAGDHRIFLGEVLALRRAPGGARPLVFFGSRYHRLEPEAPALPDETNWLHGW
jgi:flavin reductase (DIM6/NTAB) family NADH-FMN oxidoreductase RutF